VVFWDRFYREVFGSDASGLAEQLDEHRSVVNEDWRRLFDGILHEAAERLRKNPSDFGALVRGVTTYMIVIEGMLALTAARFMIKSLKERGWFPGFVQGFTAVNRDESRHVGFGVKFLADAIRADPANALVVQETLKETLPVAPLVFVPPWVDNPYDFETPFYHSSEVFAYAAKSLQKKLAAMGLDPAMLAQPAASP
jgi:ribonucleoside-diphosphate reductase beta chain